MLYAYIYAYVICTYINFSGRRYIVQTAIVKIRIGSPKRARDEQVCAHQRSYWKLIFQNIFGPSMHMRDCSCAPILQFFYAASDGATANCQIPDRILWSIFTSLKNDSAANYASIWTLCSSTVRGLDVLYNASGTLNITGQ